FEQSGARDRVGRVANALNQARQFSNDSVAFREASPASVDSRVDISNLDVNAPVLVDENMVDVESPGVVPGFIDGGYHFVDDMKNYEVPARITGFDQGVNQALLSRYQGAASNTDVQFQKPTGSQGYIDVSGGSSTDITGLIHPAIRLPVHPLGLPCRVRCIAEYTTAQRPGFMFQIFDGVGALRGTNRVQVRDAGFNGNWSSTTRRLILPGGATQRQFFGVLQFRAGPRSSISTDPNELGRLFQDGGFPTSGVVVIEATYEPFQSRVAPRYSADKISFVVGHYATIADAFAETRPGGAFSSLEVGHPNYIGANSREGRGAYFPFNVSNRVGHAQIGFGAGRWHYIEVTVGSGKNDVVNRLVGVPPDPADEFTETLEVG
ncbi:MAG: hypothetical protein K8953_13175, partial [Proteobacteria bacterium]|nr:hypothetical protein [Pseudomonadota bacterium]